MNALDEVYLLDCEDAMEGSSYKELKSTNGVLHYDSLKMVTGVKLEHFMRLGNVMPKYQSEQRHRKRMEGLGSGLNMRASMLLTAIHILKKEQFKTCCIYDGSDQKVEEFKAARNFDIPVQYRNLERGWAWRRKRGL
jgi:hypothetical protein